MNNKEINRIIQEYRFDGIILKSVFGNAYFTPKYLIKREYVYYQENKDELEDTFDEYFDNDLEQYEDFNINEFTHSLEKNFGDLLLNDHLASVSDVVEAFE